MRFLILILTLTMLSFSSDAQDNIELVLGGKQFSFKGIQTFKPSLERPSKCYYNSEGGKLFSFEITYKEDGDLFSFSKQEVLLSDLNIKSFNISDMGGDNPGSFDGWMLSIDTKRLKDKVISNMSTFLEPDPSKDEISYISFLFNTEADAKDFMEKIKKMK